MFNETTLSALISLLVLGLLIWYWTSDYSRIRRWLGSTLTAIVAGCALFAIFPNAWKLDFATHNIAKGIDLGGGTSFVIKIPETDENGNPIEVNKNTLDEVRATMEKRLADILQNRDKPITPVGDRQLEIQIPGLSEDEIAKVEAELKRPALLSLHLVNREYTREYSLNGELNQIGFEVYTVTPIGSNPETGFTDEERDGGAGQQLVVPIQPTVEGTRIRSANAVRDARGYSISVRLDRDGGKEMLGVTQAAIKKSEQTGQKERLAIVLDGKMISAPSINGVFGNQFQITGDFTQKEASDLASALSNPLRTPVEIEAGSTISPTLGAAAVSQGLWSGFAALAATLVFLVIFYRFAGLIALFGLSVNMLVLFGAIALLKQDLTLPGIAGVILTLGMAVDANVLIYERLKEELREGKSLQAALQAAYEKAFSAIFDANITSLITAIVLFLFGSDALKGFAATLTAGILGTLFAALLVTRTGFRWMTDVGFLKKLSVGSVWNLPSFEFLKRAKPAALISVAMIILAITGIALRGSNFLSLDFLGGERLSYAIPSGEKIDKQEIANTLKEELSLETNPKIEVQTTAAGVINLRVNLPLETRELAEGEQPRIQRAQESLKQFSAVQKSLEIGPPSEDKIGASFGRLMLENSAKALLIGLACIALYIMIRFQWSFAVGAIAALSHDIIIVAGIMAILGFELNTIMVGAYLTIAGYSINDTIVVFDRIRENIRESESKRPNLYALINSSLNSTLSRTLLTSGTTILAVAILALFGGPDLRAFSVAILVGVLVGTWSSLFVASPIVHALSKKKGVASLQDKPENTIAPINSSGDDTAFS